MTAEVATPGFARVFCPRRPGGPGRGYTRAVAPDADLPDPSAESLRLWQESGDLEALNRLLQLEIGVLKHMIRGRRIAGLHGSASTSDIAQEAVLGLLKTKTPPAFSEPRALRGYLWRSAWHLLVKRIEKQSKMPPRLEADDSLPADGIFSTVKGLRDIDRAERSMAIGLAMNLLSRDDRELFRLVYFEGKDIPTAGAALGLTRGAANSRLIRARRLLATRLADWSDLIDDPE
jgi:RNA polymerase sigma factor (sigma-70 family)